MSAYKNTKEYATKHPIIVGGSAVLATLLLGVGIACGTGLVTPSAAYAVPIPVITITPPIVVPVVPIIVPVTPVITPVITPVVTTPTTPATSNNTSNSNSGSGSDNTLSGSGSNDSLGSGNTNTGSGDSTQVTVQGNTTPTNPVTTAPVVTPITPEVPVTTVTVQGNSGTDSSKGSSDTLPSAPADTDTTVVVHGSTGSTDNSLPVTSGSNPVSVTVTAPSNTSNNDLPPCCTDTSGAGGVTTPATTVVTVTTPSKNGNNDLPPCCTDTTPTTPTIPVTTPTNNDLPPCCTDTTPTTPSTPVVTPPVVTPPVVVPPTTSAAICDSLTADKTQISAGDAVTLSWKTENATSISIDNGVGKVTPVSSGSTVVHPTGATTYTATVTNAVNTVTCKASVTIKITPPPATLECVALTADKTTINPGDAVTLSWKTQNATSISIDNGVGSVTPVDQGSTVVHPTAATTYTATVGDGKTTVNCQVAVKINTTPPPPSQPACLDLTADKSDISANDTVTLFWKTQNASSISIDNGIGNVTPVDSGSITVNPTQTTTYTATVPNAPANSACSVTITVENGGGHGGGGGGSNGGGGSGGHGVSGQIIQTVVPQGAYVYLSQIPYTGLDLGPIGTIIYWVFLTLWCGALAYLALFKILPFIGHKLNLFGAGVDHVLNHSVAGAATASAGAHAAGVAHLAASHAPAVDVHAPAPHAAPAHAPAHSAAPVMAAAAPVAAQGFRSFAAQGESLTVDDIVKGLSRESGPQWQVGSFHQEAAMPVAAVHEAPASHAAPAPRPNPVAAPLSADVRDFIAALLNDNRDTVFGTIRHIVREGGDAEAFLSQVVCAIDDAYRARVEGSYVHPEIAEITRGCATNFLERLVAALTNAVDSSYSVGVTGSKLALTRALAIIEG